MSIGDRSTPFLLGEWRIEPALGRISRGDEITKIDPRNMDVLLFLVGRAGEVVSQIEIEKAVWTDVVVSSNSVYQSITQLRRAFGDDKKQPRYIETMPRRGYRLVARASAETTAYPADKLTSDLTPRATLYLTSPEAEHSIPLESPLMRTRAGRRTAIAIASFVCLMTATATAYISVVRSSGTGNASSRPNAPIPSSERRVAGYGAGFQSRVDHDMAYVALSEGHVEQARAHLESALRSRRQIIGLDDTSLVGILTELANVYLWMSDYAAAESSAREAMQILEQSTPRLNPERVRSYMVLADILADTGRFAEAGLYAEQSVELARTLYGENDISAVDAAASLADVRMGQGRNREAEQLTRSLIKVHTAARGAEEHTTAYYQTLLASILLRSGRFDEGTREARSALDTLSRTVKATHPYVPSAQQILGENLIGVGENVEAEQLLKSAMQALKETNAPSWRVARAASALGESILGQHRFSEAENYLAHALRELEGATGTQQLEALHATRKRMDKLQQAQRELAAQRSSVADSLLVADPD